MDPNSLVGKITLGIIRHLVVGMFSGLALYVSKQDQAAGVTAVMTLIMIAFSVWDKFQAEQSKKAAVVAASTGQTP